MDKQKVISASKTLYTVVIGATFTVLILSFTSSWNNNPVIVLKNRLLSSFMFLGPGAVFLVFKESMVRLFFLGGGLTSFKDDESKRKAKQQVIHFGTVLSLTGGAIVVISLVLFVL
jgi:hypothetical protein